MPTRLPGPPPGRALRQLAQATRTSQSCCIARSASRTLSTTSSPRYALPAVAAHATGLHLPPDYVPSTQPPSARPPETRKSQLIRTYTSLLRSSPLILFFQHSNLTAVEWAAIRRELRASLQAVDAAGPTATSITQDIQLSVLRTRMFNVALKLVSFFDGDAAALTAAAPTAPNRGPLTHDLSATAYEAMKSLEVPPDSAYAQIEPLLVGPTAGLVFPTVSPQHLAAALRVLAPSGPAGSALAAPSRRKNPGYYDIPCQSGLQKLLLVGGRVEGSVFDVDGVKWVGGIEGGLDGLRSQLVSLLQGAGLGLTTTLEAGSKNIWMALEGRKSMLEEEQKGSGEKTEEPSG